MSPLARLAALVRSESGVTFVQERHGLLADALRRAYPGMDANAFLEFAADAREGDGAIARLIEAVTIKETYFFREQGALDGIEWHSLLERARRRGAPTIRIWSAACASGEEAYTLAIMALEAFAPDPPPVEILATDIAADALAQAREGRYRERALQLVSPAVRDRYFVADGDRTAVGDLPRRLIDFQRHNLTRDAMPPCGGELFDLVVCRNVLIYFDGETVGRVLEGLTRSLHPGGSLILGSADTLCATTQRLSVLEASQPAPTMLPLRRPAGAPAGAGWADGDAETAYKRGLREHEAGDHAAAIALLRRAVYLDPSFGLAAFALGRAHDAHGDVSAARRAYLQTLRTLHDDHTGPLVGQVNVADIALACRARLASLEDLA
jgi:chemotaxis protein methyltransferase CheR